MLSAGEDHDMATSPTNPPQDVEYVPLTKAERIQQLNEIDKSITQLLQSAGLAIKTLTACQDPSATPTDQPAAAREAFATSTQTYLDSLHSINVRIKRQVDSLRETGIIAEKRKDEAAAPEALAGFTAMENKTGGASKVNLDVGWLNSRSGKVGTDMEAELWAQARSFLERREESLGGRKPGEGDAMQT